MVNTQVLKFFGGWREIMGDLGRRTNPRVVNLVKKLGILKGR